jgi:hypothetical protein
MENAGYNLKLLAKDLAEHGNETEAIKELRDILLKLGRLFLDKVCAGPVI